jgi:DnaK suppressor protein
LSENKLDVRIFLALFQVLSGPRPFSRRKGMSKKIFDEFKNDLLQIKSKLLNSGILRSRDDLHISSDDLADEADLATSVIQQQVSFNMRRRELSKLRAVEEALRRIEDGSFGQCEECSELIGKKRLKNQPWTTLCITHAEEQERNSTRFIQNY